MNEINTDLIDFSREELSICGIKKSKSPLEAGDCLGQVKAKNIRIDRAGTENNQSIHCNERCGRS